MQTPIERMYLAGKVYIPDQAQRLSTMTGQLRAAMDDVNTVAAQMGDPSVMTDMLGVSDMVHAALRRGVVSLNDCARAVIATADEFVATDEQAAQDFRGLSSEVAEAPDREAYVPSQGRPTEDEGATTEERDERGLTREEEVESTPDPDDTPEDDLEQRDDEAEQNAPDLPETN